MTSPWDPPSTTVTFTPTEADLRAVAALAMRQSKLVLALDLGLAAIGVAGVAVDRSDTRAGTVAVSVMATLLFLPLLYWFYIANARRRTFRINAARLDLKQEFRVTWDAKGITAETTDTFTRFPWSFYRLRREDDQVVLLYQRGVLMQFMPKRALTEAQAASARPYLDRIPLKP